MSLSVAGEAVTRSVGGCIFLKRLSAFTEKGGFHLVTSSTISSVKAL